MNRFLIFVLLAFSLVVSGCDEPEKVQSEASSLAEREELREVIKDQLKVYDQAELDYEEKARPFDTSERQAELLAESDRLYQVIWKEAGELQKMLEKFEDLGGSGEWIEQVKKGRKTLALRLGK